MISNSKAHLRERSLLISMEYHQGYRSARVIKYKYVIAIDIRRYTDVNKNTRSELRIYRQKSIQEKEKIMLMWKTTFFSSVLGDMILENVRETLFFLILIQDY